MESKRHIRASQCLGKRRFSTQGESYAALSSLRRAGKSQGKINVYKCPWCKKYHFGHL